MKFSAPRLLESSEYPAYCALRREMLGDMPWSFGASPEDDAASDPVKLAERLSAPRNVIVAVFDEATGTPVSVAGLVGSERTKTRHGAGIWGVYTTPAARGQGAGRAVMNATIEMARSWEGIRKVWLSVSDDAPPARALYESLGFVVWGTEPISLVVDGVDHAEIHMALLFD